MKRRIARDKIEKRFAAKRTSQFMHKSRHVHAKKRPRGPGGRFLTKAELQALLEKQEGDETKKEGSNTTVTKGKRKKRTSTSKEALGRDKGKTSRTSKRRGGGAIEKGKTSRERGAGAKGKGKPLTTSSSSAGRRTKKRKLG